MAKSEAVKDVEIFVGDETFMVTTLDGDTVKVPKVSWGTELKVISILEKVLKVISDDVGALNLQKDGVKLVQVLMEKTPEKLTELVSVILRKEALWVEENLDSSEIISVVVPLLVARLTLITQKITPFLNKMGVKVEDQIQTGPSPTIQ